MDLYRIKKYCLNTQSIVKAENVEIISTAQDFVNKIFNFLYSAKKNILIEFYEIADDTIGCELKKILIKKAKEGVKIRVIYDSIGSRNTSKEYFRQLRENGVDVVEYNPIKIFTSVRKWFRRDHRKLLIVDFEKAIIGGFNLSLDYAPYSIGGRNWKDCGISIYGEVVCKIAEIFMQTWFDLTGELFDIDKNDRSGNIMTSVLWEFGIRNIHSIRRGYKYAIDNAKDYIFITNAYFLPDGLIYRCLKRAVLRGVDVRIIIPFKTDHPYVKLASLTIIKSLIKYGVKFYEWQKEVLHAKTAVIDDIWVSIGSHNLDRISLHYNLELNINIYDEEIARKMRDLFLDDINNSKEFTEKNLDLLPASTKILGQFIYLFRNLL